MSSATLGNGTMMNLPPSVMTSEEIEELVSQKVKEQKGNLMPLLRDTALNFFAPKILAFIVPPHVQSPKINYYRDEGNPVEHIQSHEAYLLGGTNDDNHFTLLFPATLGSVASH